MQEIKLLVTATGTDVDNQFKGAITFKNEQNEGVSFGYLCINPKNEEIDLKIYSKDEKFCIKGIISKELFNKLNEKQRLIFGLSADLVLDTIDHHEKMSSHYSMNQMMKSFGVDMHQEMSVSYEIDDNAYLLIFNEESLKEDKVKKQFYASAINLKKALGLSDSTDDIYKHEDCLKIIEMGKDVLPLILKDLEKTRDYWFYALYKITSEDPVRKEDELNPERMTERWLEWAKNKEIYY